MDRHQAALAAAAAASRGSSNKSSSSSSTHACMNERMLRDLMGKLLSLHYSSESAVYLRLSLSLPFCLDVFSVFKSSVLAATVAASKTNPAAAAAFAAAAAAVSSGLGRHRERERKKQKAKDYSDKNISSSSSSSSSKAHGSLRLWRSSDRTST
ncbi:hypothetical protein Emag_004936 [Eimeria magna]